jgi:hypothetical protein
LEDKEGWGEEKTNGGDKGDEKRRYVVQGENLRMGQKGENVERRGRGEKAVCQNGDGDNVQWVEQGDGERRGKGRG